MAINVTPKAPEIGKHRTNRNELKTRDKYKCSGVEDTGQIERSQELAVWLLYLLSFCVLRTMPPQSWVCDCGTICEHTEGVRCRDQYCTTCRRNRCPKFIVARLHESHRLWSRSFVVHMQVGMVVILDWWQMPCIQCRCVGARCPYDHISHPASVERIEGAETRDEAEYIVMRFVQAHTGQAAPSSASGQRPLKIPRHD